ncbi:MAG: hypothetical protein ACRC4O_06330 [Giesbergeria sp.]
MSVFDALLHGAILAGDDDLHVVVTWNGSCDFNLWIADTWVNVGCRTRDASTYGEARAVARQWLAELAYLEEIAEGEELADAREAATYVRRCRG